MRRQSPATSTNQGKIRHMEAKLIIDAKKNVAIIEIPLQAPRTSATGKTVNIAEARNQQTTVVHEGKALKINCQVYYKP